MSGDLDDPDVPSWVAVCYGMIIFAVLYAIKSGAPTEAYQALMVIATAIAVWRQAALSG